MQKEEWRAVAGFPGISVRNIRTKLRMSQSEFANYFGINLSTLRDWEYNRRTPVGASRLLLFVIDRNPEIVHETLQAIRAA